MDSVQSLFDDFNGTSSPQEKLQILVKIVQLYESISDQKEQSTTLYRIAELLKPYCTPQSFDTPENTLSVLKPKSEEEIIDIINEARKNNKTVRVIGSNHSYSLAIQDKTDILISLTNYRGVEINNSRVIVKAGTSLGGEPRDIEGPENSLLYQLDKNGYALPATGGITHQTVGGFISTGSAGGSLSHSFGNNITAIRLIDGNGNIRNFKYSDEDNSNFLAAGVSMGLLGVITEVTFELEPRFFITGTQTTSSIKYDGENALSRNIEIGSPIDFFGDGDHLQGIPSISNFLSNGKDHDAEYSRILWYPQEKLNRMVIWKARRISVPNLPPDPYDQLSLLEQKIARRILIFLNKFEDQISSSFVAELLKQFVKIGIEYFQDKWWTGLPMDNGLYDEVLPVDLTELWIDLKETQEVMNDLQQLFYMKPKAIGNLYTEIYATGKSKFWLSPAYNKDVVRIDVNYFFVSAKVTSKDRFKFYWDALSKYKFRCHWGKYMPDDYGDQISELYPKYEQWMKIRDEMDPDQIFVTPYWRKHLKIPGPKRH